ncbi:MAG: hypothetical protein HY904_17985 [Deltaproteobacteria bacterium]|nr:hypothetical protein [Deltaproteobacteria bacterium]
MLRPVVLALSLAAAACPAPPGPDAGPAPVHTAVQVSDGGATVAVAVPDDATAALVHVSGAPRDTRIALGSWDTRGGVLATADAGRAVTLAEMEWSAGTGLGLWGPCRTRPGWGAVAFGCPDGPAADFPAGKHVLTFRVEHVPDDGGVTPWSGVLDVQAVFAAAPPARDRVLDVRLHLHQATGLPDDNDVTHPWLLRTLDHARGVWAQAGIVLRFARVTSSRSELVLPLPSLRSAQLEDLAATLPEGTAVDVVVLERLAVSTPGTGETEVPSMVTSLPLAAGMGTVASLVLIRADWRADNVQAHERTGLLLAHELGHALGLFHPVEASASDGSFVVDPLPDTPEDDASARVNLMHRDPVATSLALTPMQRVVAHRSPFLR